MTKLANYFDNTYVAPNNLNSLETKWIVAQYPAQIGYALPFLGLNFCYKQILNSSSKYFDFCLFYQFQLDSSISSYAYKKRIMSNLVNQISNLLVESIE